MTNNQQILNAASEQEEDDLPCWNHQNPRNTHLNICHHTARLDQRDRILILKKFNIHDNWSDIVPKD